MRELSDATKNPLEHLALRDAIEAAAQKFREAGGENLPYVFTALIKNDASLCYITTNSSQASVIDMLEEQLKTFKAAAETQP